MEDNELSITDLISKAEEAHKNKDNPLAIELYREVIKIDPMQIPAYDALMKIYRQQKDYKKEIAIINSGIKVYEKYYKDHSGKHTKSVMAISEKLNKSFGLVDKKGTKLYNPEPIGRWQKRKQTVNKKLAK
jgi:tetratricopeptide (TPR) repeat protein